MGTGYSYEVIQSFDTRESWGLCSTDVLSASELCKCTLCQFHLKLKNHRNSESIKTFLKSNRIQAFVENHY